MQRGASWQRGGGGGGGGGPWRAARRGWPGGVMVAQFCGSAEVFSTAADLGGEASIGQG